MRYPGYALELGSLAAWAGLVALSLWHNLALLDDQAREVAAARARMLFSVVETTRLWNARHGGLYAPVTEDSPPNEWLDDPLRDVDVNGRLYTKINPAYMTRQMSELMDRRGGLSFRLTSLKPIRPGNAPDPWEAQALRSFQQGGTEVLERVAGEHSDQYRYMGRLLVEEACLQCHANQGYQLGEVRGGISVTFDAGQVLAEINPQKQQTIVLHLVGYVLLAGATLAFLTWLRAGWRQLAQAKADQEAMVAERTGELRRAVEDLGRSNTELENFAYAVSHDLQEPLRMIGSYAQVIDRRYAHQLDTDGREFLGFMTDGAQRMKQMIDDLLAYSRAGRTEINPQPVALQRVLDAALANLTAALQESNGHVTCDGTLPVVAGEVSMLVRVLQNLVGNALKYRHPDRDVQVVVSARPHGQGWEIRVADNGIGVPEAARERIFQVFQRLHSNTAISGTGIGLAIAKKIVERHGGHIWVEDNQPHGTVFCFTLPACPTADVPSSQQQGGAN